VITKFFFLATVFSATFEKVHWNVAGTVSIADVLAIGFVVSFFVSELRSPTHRFTRTAAIVAFFLALLFVVYLVGYFDLGSAQAVQQYWKGMIKFGIHFLFLLFGVTYLARRSADFFVRTVGWFTAGLVLNAAYGVVQLLAARSGVNLDDIVLKPITGGASAINVYGIFENTQSIFRSNALTGDPNHLGIMLALPLLMLTPLYVRLPRGHRWKLRLGLVLTFLLLVEVLTLSRSGLVGLAVGALILALPYRRTFRTRQIVVPVVVLVIGFAALVATQPGYFLKIISSRFNTSDSSAHFQVYTFVPDILHTQPGFGLGLNNFSVYYEQVTGLQNWGPHSFYVALIVETGLVGTVLFASFLIYLFLRTAYARRLGRALSQAGDPVGGRLTALAWGMTAALAGTMVANVFYLTMSFYYFYVFVTLLLALPIVYGSRLEPAVERKPRLRPPRAAVSPARAR
jgi:O-antigen ligase